MSEPEAKIHPFNIMEVVRANSDLYDKRISALTDLFHQTQLMVHEMKQGMEYVKGRIDGGLSPTMQKVKEQNESLEKALLHLENEMIIMVKDLSARVAVMDEHYKGPIEDWKEFQKGLRTIILKIIAAAATPAALAVITTWIWMNQVKAKIESLPTEYNSRHDTVGRTKHDPGP